jgi:hypothetical protein
MMQFRGIPLPLLLLFWFRKPHLSSFPWVKMLMRRKSIIDP